ncbi:hypothetical protein ACFLRC_03110 [Candidatus Altiarchaeota archaeon]
MKIDTYKAKIFSITLLFLFISVFCTAEEGHNASDEDFTHTVLVEFGTGTAGPFCPIVADYLSTIFNSGDYQFYYVTLVYDMNYQALMRCNELEMWGIPSVWMDAGYQALFGDMGSVAPYIYAINESGQRAVANVDLDLSVTWLGDNLVQVNLDITNNESTTYNGHLHAYVTEIESRWLDYSLEPYDYAMIGYAFNQDVNVSAFSTSHYSATWDGELNGFYDLEFDNIMVVASVFDSDTNYSDETAAARPDSSPDFIIDNSDPEFVVLSGSWGTANHPDAWNGSARFNRAGTGDDKVGWRVDTFIDPGLYGVYVWKFNHSHSPRMATDAPYRVFHRDGSSNWILVNQSTPGDEWIHMGDFEFDQSHTQGILMTDEANGIVIADAVKLVYLGPGSFENSFGGFGGDMFDVTLEYPDRGGRVIYL